VQVLKVPPCWAQGFYFPECLISVRHSTQAHTQISKMTLPLGTTPPPTQIVRTNAEKKGKKNCPTSAAAHKLAESLQRLPRLHLTLAAAKRTKSSPDTHGRVPQTTTAKTTNGDESNNKTTFCLCPAILGPLLLFLADFQSIPLTAIILRAHAQRTLSAGGYGRQHWLSWSAPHARELAARRFSGGFRRIPGDFASPHARRCELRATRFRSDGEWYGDGLCEVSRL